ncbi:MAG: hypothetical protein KF902_05060 [Phycisphaeraceae bacterium]|nr:hypothetical protein [Phycisphaeraceae bacterium]
MRAPLGFRAVRLGGTLGASPIGIALIVRDEPDPLGGRFVRLRETYDASVMLGALVDEREQIIEWVEFWSQRDGFSGVDPASASGISNQAMDQRWQSSAEVLAGAEPGSVIFTGFEKEPAPVLFFDPGSGRIEQAKSAGGSMWRLCVDDASLAAAGLPPYGTGSERFWIATETGNTHAFASTNEAAPKRDGVLTMREAIGPNAIVAHAGGRLMVRRYRAASYAEIVDAMTSGDWSIDEAGSAKSRVPVSFDGRGIDSSTPSRSHTKGRVSEESLILSHRGEWGALIETLHLKLRLWAEAIRCVSRAVERSERPLLNVREESFRVALSDPGPGLPRWWTARVSLAEPGEAIELGIAGGESRYFMAGRPVLGGVFRPAQVNASSSVRGTLRLRRVEIDADKSVNAEATLALPSLASIGINDLVWIRLMLAGRRIDVHGHAERSSAMAAGEWRFRSSKLVMDAQNAAALKGLEGVPVPDVEIEVVPLLSSPCDLHALGVLGARTLLNNGDLSLAVLVDELQSLARAAGELWDGNTTLSSRIQRLANNDRRWAESLGPQRLNNAGLTAESALAMIPAELWWDVVGVLARMFPGAGSDSICRDLGDAPSSSPHMVFHTPIEEIDRLLVRTRSLVVIDWGQNREISSVIRSYLLVHGNNGTA